MEFCKERGVRVRPIQYRNKYGLPVLREILLAAQNEFPHRHLIYTNFDILLNPSLLLTASYLISQRNDNKVYFELELLFSSYFQLA